ncbi:hypothetical protein V5O48_009585, partial [Marasmius crinis-equi]
MGSYTPTPTKLIETPFKVEPPPLGSSLLVTIGNHLPNDVTIISISVNHYTSPHLPSPASKCTTQNPSLTVTILDNSLVAIGNRVLIDIASNSCICAADHYTSVLSHLNYYLTSLLVRIDDDCWIGGGVHILPGVTIGRGSMIGSGSVVTRDIPPYSMALGNPARVVRMVKSPEEEREDLESRFREFMGPSWAKEKRESDTAAVVEKRVVADGKIKPSL